MEHWQTILIVKGTAGKITLFARQNEQQAWEFYRSNEAFDLSSPTIVYSFNDALALLGQSWKYLHPEYIHPDFKQLCWTSLTQESGIFNRVNWRKACM